MKRRRDTEAEADADADKGGRVWRDAATSQGVSNTVSSHHKLGRGQKGTSPGGFRGSLALPTFILDF